MWAPVGRPLQEVSPWCPEVRRASPFPGPVLRQPGLGHRALAAPGWRCRRPIWHLVHLPGGGADAQCPPLKPQEDWAGLPVGPRLPRLAGPHNTVVHPLSPVWVGSPGEGAGTGRGLGGPTFLQAQHWARPGGSRHPRGLRGRAGGLPGGSPNSEGGRGPAVLGALSGSPSTPPPCLSPGAPISPRCRAWPPQCAPTFTPYLWRRRGRRRVH